LSSKRRNFLVSVLKYSISLAIAALLFKYVYRDLDFKELFGRFKQVNLNFIYLSIFFGLISYWVRAYRWRLIFEPIGYEIRTFNSFISLMVGYFANLLVPRMGEISRCVILKKTDSIDLPSSLGTVVAERVIDMLCLLSVILLGFIIEFDKLNKTLISHITNKLRLAEHNYIFVLLGIILLLVFFVSFIFWYRKNYYKIKHNVFYLKFRSIVRDILDGILAVRKIKKPYLFWFSTVLIWVLYFFMSYFAFFSFPPTENLGIKAGILVLIMGGLGMATPVQGGVGAFHLFVSSVLLLYGVNSADGKFFAFVLHESQFLLVVVVGGISFILSLILSTKKEVDVNKRKDLKDRPVSQRVE